MSHEHRTIILPLKLVELACSIVAEAWARLLPPADESEARVCEAAERACR